MPLLRYFVVMGSVLVALLFIADAMLAKPDRPVFTSKFDTDQAVGLVASEGKPAPAPPAPHIATVPMETVAAPADTVAAATPAAPAAVEQSGVKAEAKAEAKNEPKKKKLRVARRHPKADPSENDWADNSWDNNSWDNNSWNDDSWKSHSRRNNSWRNRESRDAYAYEPHRQQDFWFR